jgi:hypothetical protein
LLLAMVTVAAGISTETTTATYGGVSMTQVERVASNNANDGYIVLFRLINPTPGTADVVVTTSISRTMEGGSLSFTGVDQTTPIAHSATAFGAFTAPSVGVASAVGNMVAGCCCNGASISGSDQTSRWIRNVNSNSAAGNAAGATKDGAAGTNTMSWTASSDWWGAIAADIAAATGGGGGGVVIPIMVHHRKQQGMQ